MGTVTWGHGERQNSKGAARGDRMIGWGIKGRGVRPARPRMTGPVIPTMTEGLIPVSGFPLSMSPARLDRRSSVGKSAGNDATADLKSSDEAPDSRL